METARAAARPQNSLASALPVLVVSIALAGCVSQGDYDVLRSQYEEQSERLADEKEALERCDKERNELESTHTRLLEEHESVAAELEEAQGKLTAWQNRLKAAEAREDNLRQTIDQLKARLRTHATTFRLRVRDVHRGRLFGLQPGAVLDGKLEDYLAPRAKNEYEWRLQEDAEIELDGITRSTLSVHLDGESRIDRVVLHFYGSGDEKVDAIRDLIDAICSADDEPVDFNPGRPGPGTPKTDPLTGKQIPLVVRSTFKCGFEAAPWRVSVFAEWLHDGADLDKIDLRLRFLSRSR